MLLLEEWLSVLNIFVVMEHDIAVGSLFVCHTLAMRQN